MDSAPLESVLGELLQLVQRHRRACRVMLNGEADSVTDDLALAPELDVVADARAPSAVPPAPEELSPDASQSMGGKTLARSSAEARPAQIQVGRRWLRVGAATSADHPPRGYRDVVCGLRWRAAGSADIARDRCGNAGPSHLLLRIPTAEEIALMRSGVARVRRRVSPQFLMMTKHTVIPISDPLRKGLSFSGGPDR
jgi:hypothetical protein